MYILLARNTFSSVKRSFLVNQVRRMRPMACLFCTVCCSNCGPSYRRVSVAVYTIIIVSRPLISLLCSTYENAIWLSSFTPSRQFQSFTGGEICEKAFVCHVFATVSPTTRVFRCFALFCFPQNYAFIVICRIMTVITFLR